MTVQYEPLGVRNLSDVVCCPGGLELKGKTFRGDLNQTTEWRRRMIALGMRGIVVYDESGPRGFAEYMPAEVAPVPIEAPGAGILMCYHWAGTEPEAPEHLARERKLIERVIEETHGEFAGFATQGWDAPTHFPVSFLEKLGFREVAREDYIALMWLSFEEGLPEPTFAPVAYTPQDLTSDGLLAIDAAFSARCPYSISSEAHLMEVVAEHPLKNRIRLTSRRIDTREDTFAYAVPPFDWAWVYLNGEEISLFELPGQKLSGEITRRIESLR